MIDIVEHLKECAKYADEYPSDVYAFKAAADEITRLREENVRLREALKPFGEMLKGNYSHQSDSMPIKAGANQYDLVFVFTLGDLRAAREALGNSNEKTGI